MKVWSVLLAFFFISTSFGQEIVLENFNTKDGLPSNEIYDLYQDINGLIWFTSDRGICSYDGAEFKHYALGDGLTSSTVFKFIPQRNGEIWCTGYNNQLFHFSTDDYKMIPYRFNDVIEKYCTPGLPEDVRIDKKGNVNIGFIDRQGLFSINSKGAVISNSVYERKKDSAYIVQRTLDDESQITYIEEDESLLPKDGDYSAVKTKYHEIFFKYCYSGNNRLLINKKAGFIFDENELVCRIEREGTPISIGMYDEDHIWIGYLEGGVIIYSMHGEQVEHFLTKESVTNVLRDHNKGTWISTLSSGVYYRAENSFRKFVFDSGVEVIDLSTTPNNDLFIGLSDGRFMKSRENGIVNVGKGKVSADAQSQYFEKNDWFIRLQDLHPVLHQTGEVLSDRYWYGISDDQRQKPVLFSRGAIGILDATKSVSHFVINDVVYDASTDGEEYFVGGNSGMYRYAIETGKKTMIAPNELNCRVSDIDNFRDSLMVVGTKGKGVFFVYNHEVVRRMSEDDGLTSNFVTEVYIEDHYTIWVCTSSGLNRVKFDSDEAFIIDNVQISDGLIDNDITDVKVVKDKVWVATRSGLSVFDVSYFKEEKSKPNYFLKLISMKVHKDDFSEGAVFNYTQNSLYFKFRAVSLKIGETCRFRYRLKGFEREWNYTEDRHCSYQQLSPGTYELTIQAGVANSWEGNIQRVTFVISPPFYKTYWFILTSIFSTLILIYLFFKYRVLIYNKDIVRELLRQFLKRIKRKSTHFTVKDGRKLIKIDSRDVLYVKSFRNYIEINTTKGKVVAREKISNFLTLVPDSIEYVRVQRSYIVRIDQVKEKKADAVTVDGVIIKIGNTYLKELKKIHL